MKQKVSNIILWILIILSFLYGVVILSYKGSYFWFNYIFIIIAFLLLLFLILKSFFPKFVFYVINVLFGLFIINFSVFLYHTFSITNVESNPKWIIILGAGIINDYPNYEFKKRLDVCLENTTPDAKIIVTGGKGTDELYSEALVGFNYLVSKGINDEQLFLEDESLSTKSNLENAKKIIEENKGSLDDSVLIISSTFHLYRAGLIAKDLGFTDVFYKGSPSYKTFTIFNYFREYAATIKYKLF